MNKRTEETIMKYGLQMYSVRDVTEKDLYGALKQVAQLGYENVEFAGFFGHSGEEVAGWLKELGLRASGTHTGYNLLDDANMAETIACHKALDCKACIVPGVGPKTQAEVDEVLANMRKYQEILKAEGITLGYHNHSHEFVPIEGGPTLMERFFNETDLMLELDTYWIYNAGEDPVAWMEKVHAAGRLSVIHIKDGFMGGEGKPLGMGTAPVAAVYAKAVELGVAMVVESETLTPSGMEEARICIEYLRSQE
jgi:sugar phosphate isomerase/epimerase